MGIDAAVNRRTTDGANPEGWFPEQKITLAEAIEAYTMGSAYAAFDEDAKGSIAPGKLGDLVVLSSDPFSEPSHSLTGMTVLYTIVDARVVYDAGR